LQIDKETGTDLWWKVIQKEMKKVKVLAFDYDTAANTQRQLCWISRNKMSHDIRRQNGLDEESPFCCW
jgi:hypothetical protein